jgi:hypothetical protein
LSPNLRLKLLGCLIERSSEWNHYESLFSFFLQFLEEWTSVTLKTLVNEVAPLHQLVGPGEGQDVVPAPTVESVMAVESLGQTPGEVSIKSL